MCAPSRERARLFRPCWRLRASSPDSSKQNLGRVLSLFAWVILSSSNKLPGCILSYPGISQLYQNSTCGYKPCSRFFSQQMSPFRWEYTERQALLLRRRRRQDQIQLGPTNGAKALHRGFPVLHEDLLRIFHLSFFFAFDAVRQLFG